MPAITSASTTTFTALTATSFDLMATGYPPPDINLTSGSLPAGVTYSSGSLAGTPEPNAFGIYALTFTASNGIGSDAVQNFSLIVSPSALDVQSRSAISANMGGGFQLAFLGNPGTQYTVQYTPNLISPNWQTLKVADPNGMFFSIDHPPAGTMARFYRAIIP